ncbi:MAG: hypothetical protein HC893_00475 [Chloroflexaceae bacterium]|nr:hypothetical protein [Chloroflexaceae bacterium]
MKNGGCTVRQLLAALQQIKQCPTLPDLRGALDDLHASLHTPDHPLHLASDDRDLPPADTVVVVRQGYLRGELEQIATAQTLERARYYLDRLTRALTEERTSTINDLNLNRWKEYTDIQTDSLWHIERRDRSGIHSAGYWGNFVPQIPNQMMRRYTRRGEWVLIRLPGRAPP